MTTIWHHVSVDIETYSDIDIKKAGLYKYAQSPAFDILLIAFAVDQGPVQIVDLTADPGGEGSGANERMTEGNPEPASAGAQRQDAGETCGRGEADRRRANWLALQEFRRLWVADDVIFHAYNAAFEHYCLNTWARRQGWETHPIGDWRCTMAHGLYCGYTAGLAATGEAMGLPQDKQKMGVGAALIRKFCVPGKEKAAPLIDGLLAEEDTLTKVRRWIAAEPEKWRLFKEYCKQDVEAEREIERRLSRWRMPAREQLLWELTVEANIEGVGVDRELVDGALYLDKAEQAALLDEAQRISGLDNPKSVQQLLKWLSKELDTDEVTDLKKATVAELREKILRSAQDDNRVDRMLELRQLMSKTSTKKYDALQAAVCDDGRVRGMMFYYGANRSGRWAGRIVQPQNLPQNHLPELDQARQLVKKLDAEMLKVCYGSVPDTLSQLIRTAFVPRPGKLYAVADYSAIEARVVAWLAGETWVLDAFRAGKDIYCATASQMFGVPVEKHGVNSELRQRGKVATLALGYGGGESALVAMGALKMGIPEEDLPEIKAKWRQANPAICALWRKIEDAAILCVRTGERQAVAVKIHDPERARANEYRTGATMGTYSDYFNTGVSITFRREADPATGQDFLTIELPARTVLTPPADDGLRAAQPVCSPFGPSGAGAGRKLFYAHPQLLPARNFPDRESLHYMSTNQTTKKWGLTDTWGGKLVENITQAAARDCLAETLLRLKRKGLTAVFHVHDEVIVEVDSAGQLDDILDIMAEPLDWAPGLPLKGAGFCCEYYQKD